MDYLKELSAKLGGKISSNNCYHWNIDLTSLRKLAIKDYGGHRFAIDEYGPSMFMVKCFIEADFSFSINNPDKLFGYNKPLGLADYPYKLYIGKEDEAPFLNEKFGGLIERFVRELKQFELTANESIFIYQNCICMALSSTRNLIIAIDILVDLVNKYDTLFKKDIKTKIFRKNIPANLHPLIPLIKKWSVSDDSDREQLVDEATEKEKKRLVKRVAPYMPEINKFLDSFEDGVLSDEALLFGNLAELVSELWSI
ncbi:hypothetical protein [Mucilaginibacter sp.]|uniref:hypothetical protein n=1 Tax=Mucilaginibacter sp. TaxID=1882438 RepID=UPI0025D290B0|nr:hypothetical protein [Mucilaginibacter sp.]